LYLKHDHKKLHCPLFASGIASKNDTEQENVCELFQLPPVEKCKKRRDPAVGEAWGLLRTIKHILGKSDRFTVFREYVASRVKYLNNL
jgi:hypothetical protein